MPDDRERLDDLRGHIDAAHAAADRLVREAQERAEATDAAFRERLRDVPEAGWAIGDEHQPEPAGPSELQLALKLLETVRDVMPPELTTQVAQALRELLLAVRALIDWYLERLDKPELAPQVEDIPID